MACFRSVLVVQEFSHSPASTCYVAGSSCYVAAASYYVLISPAAPTPFLLPFSPLPFPITMKQQLSTLIISTQQLLLPAATTSCSRCYLGAHHHLQYTESAIHRVRGREVQPAKRREVWHRHVPAQKKMIIDKKRVKLSKI